MLTMPERISYGSAYTVLAAAKRVGKGSRVAQRAYDRVLDLIASQHPPTGTFSRPVPIPRETDLSPQEYHERYVVPGRPVVIAGLCSDWPAVRKWSEEHLVGLARELPEVKSEEEARSWLETPLRLLHEIPSLGDDLRPAGLRPYAGIDDSKPFTIKLFSGPANVATRLHIDVGTNLLVHLHGTKRFTMFNREDTPFVYLDVQSSPTEYSYYSLCNGLLGDDDELLERWPLLAHATRLEATLEPGDALYIPPFCWHLAHYDTYCISAPCWWHESPLAYIRDFPLLGVLSGPAYVQNYKYNKQLQRDYPGRDYVPLQYANL